MEEAAQKIKLNITIAPGKEILIKILPDPIGVMVPLQVRATDHVLAGITPIQMEGKTLLLIGEITPGPIGEIIQGAHSIQVARQVVLQEAVRLVEAVVGIREVGTNSNTLLYENFKRAFAQWNCFALCTTNMGAEFFRNRSRIQSNTTRRQC